MDAPALLLILVAKTFFLSLPLAVAWLAFRRLALSNSVNAWIYAGVGLFAASAAAGLAPWAFGFQQVAWIFVILALLCPPLWLATVILCGMGRVSGYDAPEVQSQADVAPLNGMPRPAPLVLEQPIWPETDKPVFRTHRSILRNAREKAGARIKSDPEDRGVLDVARSMRGNPNTSKRRMRPLLPPPHAMSDLPNLPFLQR